MKTCPLSVREDILLSVHEDMSSVCIWRHVLSLYMKTCLLSVYGDMSSVCIWRHVFYLYMKTFLLSVYEDMSSVCIWRHFFCLYIKTCLLSAHEDTYSVCTWRHVFCLSIKSYRVPSRRSLPLPTLQQNQVIILQSPSRGTATQHHANVVLLWNIQADSSKTKCQHGCFNESRHFIEMFKKYVHFKKKVPKTTYTQIW